MTLYELTEKRDQYASKYSEVDAVASVLENVIESYTEYKTILEATYGANGEIIEDICTKLTDAQTNYREGYQAGDDTISPVIDELLTTSLTEYGELSSAFLQEVTNKIDELNTKHTSLAQTAAGYYSSYEYYCRKIRNGEYE